MDEETKNFVEELDEVHEPEKVEDLGFTNLPDNIYQTRLDRIYISKAKSSGRVQCVKEFEVISGEQAFRKIYKYSGMETADNLDYLTRDLRVLGVPMNFKWTDIESHFPDLLDNFYEVELVTNQKNFQNKRINKKLKSEDCMIGGAVEKQSVISDTTSNDDVPF